MSETACGQRLQTRLRLLLEFNVSRAKSTRCARCRYIFRTSRRIHVYSFDNSRTFNAPRIMLFPTKLHTLSPHLDGPRSFGSRVADVLLQVGGFGKGLWGISRWGICSQNYWRSEIVEGLQPTPLVCPCAFRRAKKSSSRSSGPHDLFDRSGFGFRNLLSLQKSPLARIAVAGLAKALQNSSHFRKASPRVSSAPFTKPPKGLPLELQHPMAGRPT